MHIYIYRERVLSFLAGSGSKESACSAEDLGLSLGSGRPPGERNGYSLQYSCLENSMDGGAWWAPWVHKESDMTELTNTLKHIQSYT